MLRGQQWHVLVAPLVAIVVAYFCFVRAEPVEIHARREVQRRQQLDNSSITITQSSSISVIPTTSNPPLASSTVDSSQLPLTSHTSNSPSGASDTSSIITSFSRSIRTFTADVVTTINGVVTTVPTTFASTTFIPTTLIPGLQDDQGSGLSDDSKKIVIGVIVGVGGAAILAGVAVVAWRHMKRAKDKQQDNSNLTYFSDDPAEGYGSAPTEGVVGEKPVETDYHRAPVVNAASNF
jgi:hypothetical protein